MTARTAASDRGRRPRRGRLPTVLFFTGAMLAPLAGIGLWFARDGGELRGTAVLAILGTVLIGLSVVLRRDADGVRIELQENLTAEIEAVRTDLGGAMTTAVQRTKHSTHAELAALQEQLDNLTARIGEDRVRETAAATMAASADPRRRSVVPPRRRDPVADSMGPGRIDPVTDSRGPGAIDPVTDSTGPGAIDPVTDRVNPGAIDPVRGGFRPGGGPPSDPGRGGSGRGGPRGGVPGRGGLPADPLRDSGRQSFEPLRVPRRSAATPNTDVPHRPPAPDPLRDSAARLDAWAGLRSDDAEPVAPSAPTARAPRRARHRAED